jgi:hypothetical protein
MDIKPGDSVAAYRKKKSKVLFNLVVGPVYAVFDSYIVILNNKNTEFEKMFSLPICDWEFKVIEIKIDEMEVK